MRRLRKLLLAAFLLSIPLSSIAADPGYFTIEINPIVNPTVDTFTPVTITAYKLNETVEDTYYGTVTFTASDGSILPDVSGNFKAGEWKGYVKFTYAGDVTLNCAGPSGSSGNTVVSVGHGVLDKLLVILPGQTYTPGVSPGVSQTVDPIYIGMHYGVTVYATDAYYNRVLTNNDLINRTLPPDAAMEFTPEPNSFTDGITYYTIAAKSPGGLINIEINSAANTAVSYFGSLTASSAGTGFTHTSAPTQVIAGEDFYVSVSVSVDNSDSSMVMDNNYDIYSFKIHDPVNDLELSDDTNRDNLSGDFQAVKGRIYINNVYFRTAMQIYLSAEKVNGDDQILVFPLSSNVITVNPNVPASVQISFSPAEVESQHQSVVSAAVFDAYGNATRSSLHDFSVNFSKASTNGAFKSGTITAQSFVTVTNDTGVATVNYEAGNSNEAVTIDVSVIDNATQSVYCSGSEVVKVSVAPTEPGKIVNYPNPFNPALNETTSINYYLEEKSDVELRIFDAFGRVVYKEDFSKDNTDLVSTNATAAGGAVWEWDGKNAEGRVVANGVYFVRIIARMPGKTQEYKRRVGVIK